MFDWWKKMSFLFVCCCSIVRGMTFLSGLLRQTFLALASIFGIVAYLLVSYIKVSTTVRVGGRCSSTIYII